MNRTDCHTHTWLKDDHSPTSHLYSFLPNSFVLLHYKCMQRKR
ncbi:hypothetical protein OIU78_020427 [Salix suchowensis]|nr:hypothetical protein OIU78_020427 [Salix suchowensis]